MLKNVTERERQHDCVLGRRQRLEPRLLSGGTNGNKRGRKKAKGEQRQSTDWGRECPGSRSSSRTRTCIQTATRNRPRRRGETLPVRKVSHYHVFSRVCYIKRRRMCAPCCLSFHSCLVRSQESSNCAESLCFIIMFLVSCLYCHNHDFMPLYS